MINLLPPQLKSEYIYGRHNMTLRRWATALVFGLAGVGVVTFGGLFLMEQSINDYKSKVSVLEATLKDQKLDETRAHAKEISSSIKLAVDVLGREVLWSQLLSQIATVIPSNANLTDLNINQAQGALEIKAIAADYTSATQIQVNLEDPGNKIFSKADIQSISCNPGAAEKNYPCTVTIKALFNENNPFLFINKGKPKS